MLELRQQPAAFKAAWVAGSAAFPQPLAHEKVVVAELSLSVRALQSLHNSCITLRQRCFGRSLQTVFFTRSDLCGLTYGLTDLEQPFKLAFGLDLLAPRSLRLRCAAGWWLCALLWAISLAWAAPSMFFSMKPHIWRQLIREAENCSP